MNNNPQEQIKEQLDDLDGIKVLQYGIKLNREKGEFYSYVDVHLDSDLFFTGFGHSADESVEDLVGQIKKILRK